MWDPCILPYKTISHAPTTFTLFSTCFQRPPVIPNQRPPYKFKLVYLYLCSIYGMHNIPVFNVATWCIASLACKIWQQLTLEEEHLQCKTTFCCPKGWSHIAGTTVSSTWYTHDVIKYSGSSDKGPSEKRTTSHKETPKCSYSHCNSSYNSFLKLPRRSLECPLFGGSTVVPQEVLLQVLLLFSFDLYRST